MAKTSRGSTLDNSSELFFNFPSVRVEQTQKLCNLLTRQRAGWRWPRKSPASAHAEKGTRELSPPDQGNVTTGCSTHRSFVTWENRTALASLGNPQLPTPLNHCVCPEPTGAVWGKTPDFFAK